MNIHAQVTCPSMQPREHEKTEMVERVMIRERAAARGEERAPLMSVVGRREREWELAESEMCSWWQLEREFDSEEVSCSFIASTLCQDSF